MNPLIGKVVSEVWLAKDKKAIKFVTDQGDVIARADGDCCSSTWIESLDDPDALLGQVLAIEDLPLGEDRSDEWECTVFYGCKITTTRGRCTIDYRNTSNGYYGGNLVWEGGDEDPYFYGGVFGQNISAEEWEKV